MKNKFTKEQQLLTYILYIEKNGKLFLPRIYAEDVVANGITTNINSLYTMLGSLVRKELVKKLAIKIGYVWVLTEYGANEAAYAANTIANSLDAGNEEDDSSYEPDDEDPQPYANDATASAHTAMNAAFESMAKSFEAMSKSFAALAQYL